MTRRPGARPPTLIPAAVPTVHLARDHPRAAVQARLRHGVWTTVRPGAYIDTPQSRNPHDVRRALAVGRIAAALRQLEAPVVASHSSAALLWGLPAPVGPTVELIQRTGPSGNARGLVRHAHALDADHETTVSGLRTTTPVRTVVDCAMSLDGRSALVVADAALHAGVRRDDCLALLEIMLGRRGVVRGRACVEFADDGAESPGESLARFALLAAGLPVPETQVQVETHLGTFWSDLGWPTWRLLAEYDGRAKYEAGGRASEAVLAEQRRQDAIEESGYRVLRITKEDLRTPGLLVRRVLRALPADAVPLPLSPRGALTAPTPTVWPRSR